MDIVVALNVHETDGFVMSRESVECTVLWSQMRFKSWLLVPVYSARREVLCSRYTL